MSAPKLDTDAASVVLRGSFNPAIFQPRWLAARGLLRETEANEATIELVHPEVTKFVAGWLTMVVTRDRFEVQTPDPQLHAPLRDLVVGVFELLEHTPATILGINRTMRYTLENESQWHALGHLLAPKAHWDPILTRPGLLSLVMQGDRQDGLAGRTIVKVSPATKNVVIIDLNNEVRPDDSDKEKTAYLVGVVRDHFERIEAESLDIARHIVSSALAV